MAESGSPCDAILLGPAAITQHSAGKRGGGGNRGIAPASGSGQRLEVRQDVHPQIHAVGRVLEPAACPEAARVRASEVTAQLPTILLLRRVATQDRSETECQWVEGHNLRPQKENGLVRVAGPSVQRIFDDLRHPVVHGNVLLTQACVQSETGLPNRERWLSNHFVCTSVNQFFANGV